VKLQKDASAADWLEQIPALDVPAVPGERPV
jgi:hypothetical protein